MYIEIYCYILLHVLLPSSLNLPPGNKIPTAADPPGLQRVTRTNSSPLRRFFYQFFIGTTIKNFCIARMRAVHSQGRMCSLVRRWQKKRWKARAVDVTRSFYKVESFKDVWKNEGWGEGKNRCFKPLSVTSTYRECEREHVTNAWELIKLTSLVEIMRYNCADYSTFTEWKKKKRKEKTITELCFKHFLSRLYFLLLWKCNCFCYNSIIIVRDINKLESWVSSIQMYNRNVLGTGESKVTRKLT